jgi:hypothetical protein
MWAPQDMARAARQAKLEALTPTERGRREVRGAAFLAGVDYAITRCAESLFPHVRITVKNLEPGAALDAFDRWEESEGR